MSDITSKVREFRQAISETQESLARRMDLATRTIARYEADRPPRGEALLRLAAIASESGREDFADDFRLTYCDEVIENLGFNLIVVPGGQRGALMLSLRSQKQVEEAVQFMSKRSGIEKDADSLSVASCGEMCKLMP